MLKIVFPWSTIKVGESVFVPCLDTDKMREMGLRAAIPYRLRLKTTPGVGGGKFGLLFTRLG